MKELSMACRVALLAASLAVAGCNEDRSGTTDTSTAVPAPPGQNASIPPNTAPAVAGAPAPEATADTTYLFQAIATDADGDMLTFSATGLPAWASIDRGTGLTSGTPRESDVGESADITISVSDGEATASLGTFRIKVKSKNIPPPAPAPSPTNQAPSISGVPATTVQATTAYTFTPTARDPEGQTLTYSIANKPGWASFSTSTGTLTGTPTRQQVRSYGNIVISVSDGAASASLPSFAINVVAPPNSAPTITGAPPTTVQATTAYTFTPTGSDSDGQTLAYSIANKPGWASFSTATGRLSGTPTAANIGTYSGITISVSDGAASASLPAFPINVTAAPNSAPSISGTPGTAAQAGVAYSFTPSAQDANGDTLTFSITGKPSWATFNTASGALGGTPSSSDVGASNTVVISVSDGKVSASLAAFTVTVAAQSTPPVVQPLGYYTDLASAPVGAFVTAYGTGFGSSGAVTLGGASQQVVSYSTTKVVFTVSGTTGELVVGGRSLGQFRVHAGRVITVTPATIQTAVASWQAGDVYYLRAGTYSGVIKSDGWNFLSNFDLLRSPGTATQPLALVAYPGESVTILNTSARPNFHFANSGGGQKANHITVAGFNLVATGTCVDSGAGGSFDQNAGAEGLRIVGNTCTITDASSNTMTGMMNFAGHDTIVLGNSFDDPVARTIYNNNHAIYVALGPRNVEVGYNTFRNLRMGHVIQVHHDGVAHTYENIRIHDNLLESDDSSAMRGITVSNVSSASTVSITRNTLRNVGQDFSGVAVYGGIVTVNDNVFYSVRAPDILLNGMALGSSGAQQRRVTASGNRFETVAGYSAVQAAGGSASLGEITLSGNMYCGQSAPQQDASPLPCN
jgi:Putative Ig domain